MLGSTESQKVQCRIISGTNHDLKQLIGQGKFRADLYHRLNMINIHIQPLRDRREDIIPLAKYFLERFTDTYNKKINDFSDSAANRLQEYEWPGNVRELRNVIEKTVIFASKLIISADEIGKAMDKGPLL